jgi:hypothetical protein
MLSARPMSVQQNNFFAFRLLALRREKAAHVFSVRARPVSAQNDLGGSPEFHQRPHPHFSSQIQPTKHLCTHSI